MKILKNRGRNGRKTRNVSKTIQTKVLGYEHPEKKGRKMSTMDMRRRWKNVLFMSVAIICLLLAGGCGGGEKSKSSSAVKTEDNAASRLSFRIDDAGDATYKQHINDLWEKTKPLLRADAAADLNDEQLLQRGKEFKQAWVNLQAHGSIHHQAKRDSGEEDTKEHKLANMTANVIGLIDDLYGWPANTKEKREEIRSNLRKGRLEHKIKEFDEVLKKVNVN